MKPNIEFHIDRLILEGFSPNDAHYIGLSVRTELNRLISVNGLPDKFQVPGNQKLINTKPIQLKQSNAPEKIGTKIANTIYQGITTSSETK